MRGKQEKPFQKATKEKLIKRATKEKLIKRATKEKLTKRATKEKVEQPMETKTMMHPSWEAQKENREKQRLHIDANAPKQNTSVVFD